MHRRSYIVSPLLFAVIFTSLTARTQTADQPVRKAAITQLIHVLSDVLVQNIEASLATRKSQTGIELSVIVSDLTPQMKVCANNADYDYAGELAARWYKDGSKGIVMIVFPAIGGVQIGLSDELKKTYDVKAILTTMADDPEERRLTAETDKDPQAVAYEVIIKTLPVLMNIHLHPELKLVSAATIR